MKKIFFIIIVIAAIVQVLSEGDDSDYSQATPEISATSSNDFKPQKNHVFCIDGGQTTGKEYNIAVSEIDIRYGPGGNYGKIINKKATDALEGTHYLSVDNGTVVFEECTKGDWSWVRVLYPDWLQDSHRGWIPSAFLDKGQSQNIAGDPYLRKIHSYALFPYDEKNYPKTTRQYKIRLEEIELLRRKAAEIAIDSGRCDFVEIVELSLSKSSLSHLHFWIDCRNKQRIRLDEFVIKGKKDIIVEK